MPSSRLSTNSLVHSYDPPGICWAPSLGRAVLGTDPRFSSAGGGTGGRASRVGQARLWERGRGKSCLGKVPGRGTSRGACKEARLCAEFGGGGSGLGVGVGRKTPHSLLGWDRWLRLSPGATLPLQRRRWWELEAHLLVCSRGDDFGEFWQLDLGTVSEVVVDEQGCSRCQGCSSSSWAGGCFPCFGVRGR